MKNEQLTGEVNVTGKYYLLNAHTKLDRAVAILEGDYMPAPKDVSPLFNLWDELSGEIKVKPQKLPANYKVQASPFAAVEPFCKEATKCGNDRPMSRALLVSPTGGLLEVTDGIALIRVPNLTHKGLTHGAYWVVPPSDKYVVGNKIETCPQMVDDKSKPRGCMGYPQIETELPWRMPNTAAVYDPTAAKCRKLPGQTLTETDIQRVYAGYQMHKLRPGTWKSPHFLLRLQTTGGAPAYVSLRLIWSTLQTLSRLGYPAGNIVAMDAEDAVVIRTASQDAGALIMPIRMDRQNAPHIRL